MSSRENSTYQYKVITALNKPYSCQFRKIFSENTMMRLNLRLAFGGCIRYNLTIFSHSMKSMRP